MNQKITSAVIGSTGYVGLELVKILNRHPKVKINFLGCENSKNLNEKELDEIIKLLIQGVDLQKKVDEDLTWLKETDEQES